MLDVDATGPVEHPFLGHDRQLTLAYAQRRLQVAAEFVIPRSASAQFSSRESSPSS